MEENFIIYYDKQNRITKLTDKIFGETEYFYSNGLLDKTITKNKIGITRHDYKYDQNKNIVEFREFENDTLVYTKKSIYDSKSRIIERTNIYTYTKSYNSSEKYVYDKKGNFYVAQSYDENNIISDTYLKIYYDKKGNIIKFENIPKGYEVSSTFEYDKSGNLLRKQILDHYGKRNQNIIYKNKYDKIGNIILREKFLEDKLIARTNYEITYW